MKKLLLSLTAGAAALAAVTSASAADLGVRARPAPPPMMTPVPVFTWTGFYVGANVGWSWGRFEGTSTALGLTTNSSTDIDGVIGGGQLGYSWQTGPVVLGIEADIQGSDEHQSDTFTLAGIAATEDTRLDSFATVRGRIGVTPWDRGLLYFTGGWAWMHGHSDITGTVGGVSSTLLDMSANRNGWTIGGGYEQYIWDRWSAKLEYLYIRSDDVTASTTILGAPVTASGRFTDNIVRAGLNYHF